MLCSSPHSHGKERNNQNQDKNRVNAGFLIGRFDLLFRNGFFNHAALELETAFVIFILRNCATGQFVFQFFELVAIDRNISLRKLFGARVLFTECQQRNTNDQKQDDDHRSG
jgi:hypothetical protein